MAENKNMEKQTKESNLQKEEWKQDEMEDLSTFADRTTCHGPRMIASSKSYFRKAFWCIAFVTVIGVLIGQVIHHTNIYREESTFQDTHTTYAVRIPKVKWIRISLYIWLCFWQN